MAGKIIVANAVVRQPGMMYYVDGDGNVCETKMQHGIKKGTKKKKTVVKRAKKTAAK